MRVARLHEAGVLHNDLEPRNVVISERSGPRIIDFDNATLNHTCGGISCEELAELARNLSLDLGELDHDWTSARLTMYIYRTRTFPGRSPAARTTMALDSVLVSLLVCRVLVYGDSPV
jgi:serine/threonine protein kinase